MFGSVGEKYNKRETLGCKVRKIPIKSLPLWFDTNTRCMDKLLETIIEAIKDKKGKNIVSLDMNAVDGAICSHFVICNADSTAQVAAIAAGIEEETEKQLKTRVWRVDGAANALWIAMDYVDIVVHIFQTEMRAFYKLDDLWADAPLTRYDYEI
jgi:ribosome-associated protein